MEATMPDVALCVPTLNRSERLERLLESVGRTETLDRVIVADNGKQSPEKQALYEDRDWPFNLTVLSLEYDIGVGTCFDEALNWVMGAVDYLIAAADDHALTPGIDVLIDQLEADSSLGGIAGTIIEPGEGRVWQSAKDFVEYENNLVRTARHDREMRMVDGWPVAEFDFIPYPTAFRIEALKDYSWDPEYPLGRTHADLYVGHWKRTDWRFAVNPTVGFYHYPGGDAEYEEHRRDEDKLKFAHEYFREKWGYDQLLGDPDHRYWFDTE